uniref:Rabphilin 3A-like (without C2 domains) n=1 Tax=Cyprinus carpio TaxID=7962 RepID=A0A8C1WUF7_CYPCA
MTDAMFGSENEHWVCPNDRQLALRAKLHTGWSFHTFQSERERKAQTLEKRELDLIMSVIHRAEQLEIIEQHRIGRLVERLENMRRSAVGNGLSQCLLCGEVFGLLSSPSVLCLDCCMKVCTKCGIETAGSQKRAQWLCKICSERREVWKRSGAWFYKALPKHIRPIKDSILDNRKQVSYLVKCPRHEYYIKSFKLIQHTNGSTIILIKNGFAQIFCIQNERTFIFPPIYDNIINCSTKNVLQVFYFFLKSVFFFFKLTPQCAR